MNDLERRLRAATETQVAVPDVDELLDDIRRGVRTRQVRRTVVGGAVAAVLLVGGGAAVLTHGPVDGPEPAPPPVTPERADDLTSAVKSIRGSADGIYGTTADWRFWVDDGGGPDVRGRLPDPPFGVFMAPDGLIGVASHGDAVSRTRDGGHTWSRPEQLDGCGILADVEFLDDEVILIQAHGNQFCDVAQPIWRSSGDSDEWSPVVLPGGEDIDTPAFPVTTPDGPGIALVEGWRGEGIDLVWTVDGRSWTSTRLQEPCNGRPTPTDLGLFLGCVGPEGFAVHLSRDLGTFEALGDPVPEVEGSLGLGVSAYSGQVRAEPLPVLSPEGDVHLLLSPRDERGTAYPLPGWLLTPEGNVEVTVPRAVSDAAETFAGAFWNGVLSHVGWVQGATYVVDTDRPVTSPEPPEVLVTRDGGLTWEPWAR